MSIIYRLINSAKSLNDYYQEPDWVFGRVGECMKVAGMGGILRGYALIAADN